MPGWGPDSAPHGRPPAGPRPDEDGTNEQLMQAFAGGDLDAYGALVARHRDMVVRFCRRMTPDGPTAEDAAQDAFVALFRSRGRYIPSAPFRAFLYRLARNACVDAARRRRGDPAIGDGTGERPDPSPSPEARAEVAERAERVRLLETGL